MLTDLQRVEAELESAARLHSAELTAIAHHAPSKLENMHDGLFSDPTAGLKDSGAIAAQAAEITAGYELALRNERRRQNRLAREAEQAAKGTDGS